MSNRGEVLIFLGVFRPLGVQFDGAAQMVDCRIRVTVERLEAGEVVEQAGIVRVLAEPVRDRLACRSVVAGPPSRDGLGNPLPRRDFVWPPGSAADGQRGRVRPGCDGASLRCGITDENNGPGRRLELVPGNGEQCGPVEDDVQLLVPPGTAAELVVLLDQLVARRLGPVGVDPERAYAERPPERLPLELAESGQRLDVGEADDRVRLAQRVGAPSGNAASLLGREHQARGRTRPRQGCSTALARARVVSGAAWSRARSQACIAWRGTNASRTAAPCEPCAGRPSCARPCGRRGSGSPRV